jgi:transposase
VLTGPAPLRQAQAGLNTRQLLLRCRRMRTPALPAVYGVGTEVAVQLLTTAGDNPERLRSEAAFAQLCGTAPLPASSGRTTREHLSPRGTARS